MTSLSVSSFRQHEALDSSVLTFSSNRLNHIFTLAPPDLARSHGHREALWNTAKVISIVGYLALAGTAFVTTSLFAPSYILLTTFAAFLSMPVAVNAYSFAHEKSEDHALGRQKFKRIAEIHNQLDQLSPDQLQEAYAVYGLYNWRIQNFQDLKEGFTELSVGLATLMYLTERAQELFQRHKQVVEQIKANENPQFSYLRMQEAHYLQQAFLANWVHAAYTRALLTNPYSQKTLDDFGSLTKIPPEIYALEKLYGKTLPVFVFKESERPALGESDIRVVDPSITYNYQAEAASSLEDLSSKFALN